jgi:uncharacterized membrane protein
MRQADMILRIAEESVSEPDDRRNIERRYLRLVARRVRRRELIARGPRRHPGGPGRSGFG